MKKLKFTLLLIASLCFIPIMSSGQAFDRTKELMRLTSVPNSPEAQAFSKYGNVDVGLYTGTPNIQVPIYVHKGRELDLPISLSYDASGIKVEQEATNIGLGWNLNVGGRISRMANGLPDDYYLSNDASNGVLGTSVPYKTLWNTEVRQGIQQYVDNYQSFPSKQAAIDYLQFMKRLNDNEFDALPDYFSFNALGINDMFVIDVDSGEARALNNPRIKVNCHKTFSSGAGTPIMKWTVTMDDGAKFIFDQYIDESGVSKKALEITFAQRDNDNSVVALNGLNQRYNSSWLLTEIISPTGKDNYKFVYHNFGYNPLSTTKALLSSVVNYTQNPNPGPYGNPNFVSQTTEAGRNHLARFEIQQLGLVKIIHNSNVIVDINLKDRSDLNIASAVDKIEILNEGNLHQAFKLNHTYFTAPGSGSQYSHSRLKLDTVEILDSNNSVLNSYAFDYLNPNQLPAKNSFSQDYYGYFNGKSNSVLYPKTIHEYVTDGADRSVSFYHAQNGLLNKITYPTGGHTLFNYEPNRSTYVTPYEEEDHTFFQTKAFVTIQGGELCNGFYNCPDSECETNDCIGSYSEVGAHGPPKYAHKVIYISEPGEYLYTATQSVTNTTTAGSTPMQRAIMFKRTDHDPANPHTPIPYRIDEIFDFSGTNSSSPIVQMANNYAFLSQSSDNYNDVEIPVILEEGYYQITLVNPQVGSSTTFRIGKYETSTTGSGGEQLQIVKAGVRINSIEDYTKENEIALRKEYDYSDGVVISQPSYEYLVSDYTIEDYLSEQALPPMLYRNTHASGTSKPHIGYASVTESVVDFNDATNKISTKNDFYTTQWGSYFSGVYNYYINGKETATNYGVNYSLGKPKEVKSDGYMESETTELVGYGTKYIQTYAYEDKQYYRNRGVYMRAVESRSHLYSCPKQSTTGTWFIAYHLPEVVPTYGGTLLDYILGGSGEVSDGGTAGGVPIFGDDSDPSGGGESGGSGLEYQQPPQCLELGIPSELCSTALGRLNLQVVSAFGKAGYIKQSSNYERDAFGPETEDETSLYTDAIKIETTYDYYNDEDALPYNFLPKKQTTTSSNNRVVVQEFKYPENFIGIDNGEYEGLRAQNMVAVPVETETYEGFEGNITLKARQKTKYDSGILPKRIQTAKDNDPLENRIELERYRFNNLVQARQENGAPVAYIWGYDNRYVVAKIENATYAEVEALNGFGSGFNISEGLTTAQEQTLRTQLTHAFVTTYSYKPLVGVKTITDPIGNTMTYEYDAAHRLQRVRDKDGNILSETNYNYRTQN